MGTLRTSWPASFRKAKALPQEEVADLIEALIAELDCREPDPDMEDSETGSVTVDDRGREIYDMSFVRSEDDEDDPDREDDDPAGGAADDEGEPDAAYPTKPLYGIDQSAGPINRGAGIREHQISMMRPEDQARMRAQIERSGR